MTPVAGEFKRHGAGCRGFDPHCPVCRLTVRDVTGQALRGVMVRLGTIAMSLAICVGVAHLAWSGLFARPADPVAAGPAAATVRTEVLAATVVPDRPARSVPEASASAGPTRAVPAGTEAPVQPRDLATLRALTGPSSGPSEAAEATASWAAVPAAPMPARGETAVVPPTAPRPRVPADPPRPSYVQTASVRESLSLPGAERRAPRSVPGPAALRAPTVPGGPDLADTRAPAELAVAAAPVLRPKSRPEDTTVAVARAATDTPGSVAVEAAPQRPMPRPASATRLSDVPPPRVVAVAPTPETRRTPPSALPAPAGGGAAVGLSVVGIFDVGQESWVLLKTAGGEIFRVSRTETFRNVSVMTVDRDSAALLVAGRRVLVRIGDRV